jgi:non-heme chloroperoxidase
VAKGCFPAGKRYSSNLGWRQLAVYRSSWGCFAIIEKMKRTLIRVLVSFTLWIIGVAALIVFGTARPPPAAASITGPFAAINDRDLPELRRYPARDGAQLSFRLYPATGRQVAVLIHGSAGSSVDMHPLATALHRAGVTVLVPDVRGHGSNRPHGDITYVGQLDDDLADFVTNERPLFPNTVWTTIGFSSGAGFTLRVAAEAPLGRIFDQYILVSPYLKYNAPSVRQADEPAKRESLKPESAASPSWAAVSTGRIIGLSILNFFGVRLWDGLPVLTFPVPENLDAVTRTYSWRLQQNFGAHPDYLSDIRAVARPVHVYVGGADELLDAEKLRAEFQSQRGDIPVFILPGLGHADMVTRDEALRAIVANFP